MAKRQKRLKPRAKIALFLAVQIILQSLSPVASLYAEEIATSSAVAESLDKLFPEQNSTSSAFPPEIEISLPPTPTPTEPVLTDFISPVPEATPTAVLGEIEKTLKPLLAANNFEASKTVDILLRDYYGEDLDVEVKRTGGEEIQVEKETKEGVLKLAIGNTNLKPGKFFVTITTKEGERILESEFLWGVLAINTEKSIYLPGEKASLAMAVLDEEGNMVCDARLKLFIISPEGKETVLSTKDNTITVNPECFIHDYTYKPDYEAFYQTEGIGAYNLRLLAETKNGELEVKDSFEVRESVKFDVARDSATRVYPPKKYPVTFYITANEDFEGVVEETVPYDFEIFPAENNQSYDSVEIKEIENTYQIELPFEGEYEQSFGFGELSDSEEINEKMQSFGIIGHDGIDYALPEGTEVLAVDSGEVIKAQWADYGNTVIIEHEWGRSYYGHLSEFKVEKGQKVQKGEIVALSGSTGFVTSPHLHFSLRPKGADFENGYFGKVDPQTYLASNGESNVLGMSLGTRVKVISWKVSVKKGEKLSLGYWFDSPDISPQFYLLGPLTFKSQTPNSNKQETAFQETRQWQIANDAQLLTNPSFTGGYTGWTLSPSSSVYDSSTYQDSAGSIHATAAGNGVSQTATATQTISSSIAAGSTVSFGLYYQKTSSVRDCAVNRVSVYAAKPSAPSSYSELWYNDSTAYASWTQVSNQDISSFFTETGQYNFRFQLSVTSGGHKNATCNAWIDNASLDVAVATTTLGDGTDPGNSTVAPGGSATDLDAFTFTTNTGTDTITAVTATLNSYTGIGQADITDSSNVAQCTALTNPSSTTLNFTGCSLSVGTTATTYKIRITPKAHGDMPVVPGGEYAITGTVTSWTGSNTTHAGTDTDSATVTIDNLSPGSATSTSGSAGNAQVIINWTTSSSVDFSRSVVLRWTAGSSGAEVPVEGQDYTAGNTISTATVACVRTGDSSSTSVNCTDSSVSNGTTYSYKIFQKDSNGNYDAGVTVSGSPFTPSLSGITVSGVIYSDEGLSTYDCSVNNLTVSVRVGGSGSYSGICTGVGGSFSVSNVTIGSAGDVVTVFIDGETEKAVTVARASNTTSDISTSLYQNRILLTHEDSGPVTNANLQTCDSGCDSDIQFTVTGGVLSVNSGNKIVVAPGKTYTPGGNMTVPSIGVGGTFNPESNTVSLTGSGIGTTCTDAPGTVMPLCVNGGTFNASNSTINYVAPAATTIAAATYFNLGVGTSAEAGAGATYTLGGNVNIGGTFTVGNDSSTNSDTLDASSYTLTLSGEGTPFNLTSKGIFLANTSTVNYTGGNGTNVTVATYYNLGVKPAGASTHNFASGTTTVNNDLNVASTYWDSNYSYSKQLTVTTAVGNGVSAGYSVKYSASGDEAAAIYNNSLSTGNDFRIIFYNNGIWTELDRDLVSFTSTSIEVWFKLQEDISASSSSSKYYFYYGYASAGMPPSNKDNVYRFSDDFSDNNIDSNKWQTVSGGGGSIAEINQEIQITSDGINRIYLRSATTFSAGYEVSVRAKKSQNIEIAVNWDGAVGTSYDRIRSGYYMPIYISWSVPTTFTFYKWVNSIETELGKYDISLDTSYHTYKVKSLSTGLTVTHDGTQVFTSADTTYISGYIGLSARETPAALNSYYDDVVLRDLVATEPTVTSADVMATADASVNSAVLDVNGNITIASSGSFKAHASNSLTIAGDFTNNGTFTANSGTVIFDDSTKTSNIWYGGVGSTQPFHNLTIATAGKQMKFDETEMTGVGGTFSVQGTNCTTGRVFLDSTTDGNQWDINVTGSADIDYADVEDSNAVVALAADNSTEDNVGNTNWTINEGMCISTLTQVHYRWSNDDGGESHGVGGTWYNDSWDYRKSINIGNSNGALSDFQVSFVLNTSALVSEGKLRSDCADMRFTDNDQTTLINHWIEYGCNTTSTRVWVKIPSLPATSSKDIYFYYGNSEAGSTANGDNTFELFDDFTGSSIDTNKWNDYNPNSYGTMTVSNGILTISVTDTGSASTAKYRGIMSKNTFSFSDHIIEAYSDRVFNDMGTYAEVIQQNYVVSDMANPSGLCADGVTGEGNQYLFRYQRFNGIFGIDTQGYTLVRCTNGVMDDSGGSSVDDNNPSNFLWERYSWYTGPNQKSGRSTDGTNFSATWSDKTYTLFSLPTSKYFGIVVTNKSRYSHTVYVDWIRIRKYASIEPTAQIGTETSQPANATWKGDEDTAITDVAKNENIRMRASVKNVGLGTTVNLRLQVAAKGAAASCEAVSSGSFSDVPTTAGSAVAVMATSTNFSDQDTTTAQLTSSASTFVSGKMVEYPSSQTNSISLLNDEYTEAEYNFQITDNASGNTTYCFRVANAGSGLNSYTNVAALTTVASVSNEAPSAPQTPHANNDNAQTGQTSPVYGLIDHTPAFSAVFDDPDTSDTAVYYQLQVGTDTDWAVAEMWDSTKTGITACNENSRCGDIIYNGSALADNTTYYWRIKFWDNSDAEGVWSSTQEFSMNDEPTVLSIILNGGQNIQPIEGTTVGVGWTASVTDPGGYEEISTVVGKLYRSGVSGAEACTPDNNNCYSDASCSLTDCSGNTCTATCSVDVFFHADPTDEGSTYEAQYWRAWIKATDTYTETGENYSGVDAVDLNSLVALSIDESIYYGSLLPGDSTSNKQTIITNTGNFDLDMMVSGYDMCTDYPTCTGYMITVANQQYSLNTFTFGDGVSLSGTEARVQINLTKPTTSPSDSSGTLYWGISIPDIKETGSYIGRNDILATADDGS